MNYNGFNTFPAGPFPVSPGPVPATPNNYPQQMPTFQNIAQPQNDFKWVQGIEGAKAYPVAPNAVVELWDSESQTIYIKSADRTGTFDGHLGRASRVRADSGRQALSVFYSKAKGRGGVKTSPLFL